MTRKMGLLAGLGMLMAVTSGCSDEVEPGDYVVYRIGSTNQSLSGDCTMGPNEVQDSSSLRASGTIVLYAGREGEYFLEMPESTLEGEMGGDTANGILYQFEGQTVDVEFDDPKGQGTQWVVTVKTDVELEIDGQLALGETSVKTSYSCTGDCGTIPGACTVKTKFVGTEVEDVGLEHDVN